VPLRRKLHACESGPVRAEDGGAKPPLHGTPKDDGLKPGGSPESAGECAGARASRAMKKRKRSSTLRPISYIMLTRVFP